MDYKALETSYNGYKFRSRLEARWAVFFDALNIKYIYEPEGYALSDGNYYLPDFMLPDFGYYAEVKGYNNNLTNDFKRMYRFVSDKKTALLILSEIPYDESANGLFWFPILYYTARSGGMVDGCRTFFLEYCHKDGGYLQDDFAVGCASHVYFPTDRNDFIDLSMQNRGLYDIAQAISGAVLDGKEYPIKTSFKDELIPVKNALAKARQARFEHGETPIVGR